MTEINKEFKLNIFKCKNVKTPTKAWDAAGWDFFIPENLTVKDFGKNYVTFFNEYNYHNGAGEFGNSSVLFVNTGDEKYEVVFSIQVSEDNHLEPMINIFQGQKNVGRYNYNEIINGESNNDIVNNVLSDNSYIYQIIVDPTGRVLIPSGIHVNLPENVFLKAENKSGIASKRGLVIGASVIDVDYEGEIHINLINTSNNAVILKAGEKIVQFVPYFQPVMREVSEYNSLEELYKNKESQRGAGGFGSSGTK